MDCTGYCLLISHSHIIELILGIRVANDNSIVENGLLSFLSGCSFLGLEINLDVNCDCSDNWLLALSSLFLGKMIRPRDLYNYYDGLLGMATLDGYYFEQNYESRCR